jgi:phosphatidate phosphatase APP1
MKPYPLDIVDDRQLSPTYDGPIHIWDIDKTYLATRFSSAKHLARIPFEFAIDKKSIPGMPAILRAIRRGTGNDFACTPLYFISASPPMLRQAIQRKMSLDGVDYDGITFKSWSTIVRSLRLQRLRDQIGFKLCALLTSRIKRPTALEYLYGDDVEFDAIAYHLYASLLTTALNTSTAQSLLQKEHLGHEDQRCILNLFEQLP